MPVNVDLVTVPEAPFNTLTPVNAEAPCNLLSLILVLMSESVVPASRDWKTSFTPVRPEIVEFTTMWAAPPLAKAKVC